MFWRSLRKSVFSILHDLSWSLQQTALKHLLNLSLKNMDSDPWPLLGSDSLQTWFFSGFNFATVKVVYIAAMTNHVFMSFSAVQIYELSCIPLHYEVNQTVSKVLPKVDLSSASCIHTYIHIHTRKVYEEIKITLSLIYLVFLFTVELGRENSKVWGDFNRLSKTWMNEWMNEWMNDFI